MISVNGSESRIVFIDHQHGDIKVKRWRGGESRGPSVRFFSVGKSAVDLQPARRPGGDGRGPK